MTTPRLLTIGLTGGIGSGKTAASRHFETLGVAVIDADVVAREVVEPGMPALRVIADRFGDSILTVDGALDRAALRQIVFADPAQRQWLESLLHPLIRQRIQDQLAAANGPYVILVSPLLLETDQRKLVNRVLLIDVPEALQIQRTMQRDSNSQQQVEAIVATQSARAFKQAQADDIIVNDHDLSHLHAQVEAQHQRYLKLAAESHEQLP